MNTDQGDTDPSPDYEVGYGKPPKHTQFRKGQSGNPRGRPKGSKNIHTYVDEELNETVTVREGDRIVRLPKAHLIAKRLTNEAAKGDMRAIGAILNVFGQQRDSDDRGSQPQPLSDDEQEVLDSLLARHLQHGSALDTANTPDAATAG